MINVSQLKYLTTGLGILLIAAGLFSCQGLNQFNESAVLTQGTVTHVWKSGIGGSSTYYPVVEFTTNDGETVSFKQLPGTNSPAYREGETVEVLYPKENPTDAMIKGAPTPYRLPKFLTILGVILFAVGGYLVRKDRSKRQHALKLKAQGLHLQSSSYRVEQDTSITVLGKHPYRIIVTVEDTQPPSTETYTSENVWINPSAYLEGKQIDIYVDRENPKHYYVDLSFLPAAQSGK